MSLLRTLTGAACREAGQRVSVALALGTVRRSAAPLGPGHPVDPPACAAAAGRTPGR